MKQIQFDNKIELYALSMGSIFKVHYVCDTDEEANAIMEKNPKIGLIAIDGSDRKYLADIQGTKSPSSLIRD